MSVILRSLSAVGLLLGLVGQTSGAPPLVIPFETPQIKGSVPDDVTPDELMAFLQTKNDAVDLSDYGNLAYNYMEYGEAKKYGGPLRWDWAFFQMMHETNSLKYTGKVKREQWNFAGIGAVTIDPNTGAAAQGWKYTNVDDGVIGHIQHLALYAGVQLPANSLVSRYTQGARSTILARRADVFNDLSGRWATWPNGGLEYGRKIADYAHEFGTRYKGNLSSKWEPFAGLMVGQLAQLAGHNLTSFRWTSDDLVFVVRPFKEEGWVLKSRDMDGTVHPVKMQIQFTSQPATPNARPADFYDGKATIDIRLSAEPQRITVLNDGAIEGVWKVETILQSGGKSTKQETSGKWKAKPFQGGKMLSVTLSSPEAQAYPSIFTLQHVP